MNSIDGVVGNTRITAMERYGTGAKIGNLTLPSFKKSTGMYTKTEPAMSDEELKEAISKIAREDAEKGLFHSETKEYSDLRKEYISSVSPDRESIITNSIKEIDSIKRTMAKTNSPERATTLLQLLMDMGKKGNKTIGNAMYDKACLEGDKLTFVEFYDNNGEMVGSYSNSINGNNGWKSFLTKAETARLQEFASTYNETWWSVNAEIKAQKNPSVQKHLEGGTTFDAYA
jgi:uncharacterized protein YnzC (UPF0291/DUF896 family)